MADNERLKDATAKVTAQASMGTGFCVAPGLIATCKHVAGELNDKLTITLRGDRKLDGTVVEVDDANDVALIQVANADVGWPTLQLSEPIPDLYNMDWLVYGFPKELAEATMDGQVQDANASDPRQRPALQLYSRNAAAYGASLSGFSGSAVMFRGRVIGQVRNTPKDFEGYTRYGIVYATPVAAITALVQKRFPGLRAQRRAPRRPDDDYDPTWYLHRRDEERRALDALETRRPVIVVGPQGFGKTSLLQYVVDSARTKDQVEGRRSRAVTIDLGGLGLPTRSTLPEFFFTFLQALLLEMELDADVYLNKHSRDGVTLTTPRAAMLIEEILKLSDQLLYVVLPRAEELIDWKLGGQDPGLDKLFGVFRGWLQDQAASFRRLRVLVEFSTARRLVSDALPNFNIAQAIELEYLSRDNVIELAAMYELPWSGDEVAELHGLVNGHPYLTRLAMYRAARDTLDARTIIDNAKRDGGIFGEFLSTNLTPILDSDPLRTVVCSVACRNETNGHPQNIIERLCGAGILRRAKNRDVFVAFPLFETYVREQRVCL